MDTTQYLKEIHPLGGGVVLWESVTVNAMHAEGHRQALKRFERLVRAPIAFSGDEK